MAMPLTQNDKWNGNFFIHFFFLQHQSEQEMIIKMFSSHSSWKCTSTFFSSTLPPILFIFEVTRYIHLIERNFFCLSSLPFVIANKLFLQFLFFSHFYKWWCMDFFDLDNFHYYLILFCGDYREKRHFNDAPWCHKRIICFHRWW